MCGIASGRGDEAWLPRSFVHGWTAIDTKAQGEDEASTRLEDELDRY